MSPKCHHLTSGMAKINLENWKEAQHGVKRRVEGPKYFGRHNSRVKTVDSYAWSKHHCTGWWGRNNKFELFTRVFKCRCQVSGGENLAQLGIVVGLLKQNMLMHSDIFAPFKRLPSKRHRTIPSWGCRSWEILVKCAPEKKRLWFARSRFAWEGLWNSWKTSGFDFDELSSEEITRGGGPFHPLSDHILVTELKKGLSPDSFLASSLVNRMFPSLETL